MNAPWNNEDLRRAFDADFDALVAFASRSKARVGFAFLRADGQVDLGRPLDARISARMTHVFALAQGGQGRESTPEVVPARRHHEQVADRHNASALERFRGLLGQPQGQGNVKRAHDEHPATRLAPLCPPSHVSRSIEDDASRVDSS